MRIKNLTSNASDQSILCLLALFLVFLIIDVVILFSALNSGMTLSESFNWIYSSFFEAELEMKFVSVVLLVFPFLWLTLLVYQLRVRIADEILVHKSKDFIKYIDFMRDRVKLTYLNSTTIKEIYYRDIVSLELVIDTSVAYNKYAAPYSVIQGLYININSGSYICSIHHAPVDLDKLYKIIFYSQYVKKFSYRFTGIGEETKVALEKIIEDYIQNNYRKTLRTYLSSPVITFIGIFIFSFILAIICAIVGCGSIDAFISLIMGQ